MALRGRPRHPHPALTRNAVAMRKLRARRQGKSNGMPNTIDEINAQAAAAGAVSAGAARRRCLRTACAARFISANPRSTSFCHRGFLKTERPDWFTMQNALFDVLDAPGPPTSHQSSRRPPTLFRRNAHARPRHQLRSSRPPPSRSSNDSGPCLRSRRHGDPQRQAFDTVPNLRIKQ
jgi:hypothetical protein